MSLKSHILNITIVFFTSALFFGCMSSNRSRPEVTLINQTPTPYLSTSTPMPTFTPTAAGLGSTENPIIIAVVSENPDQVQLDALSALSGSLSASLGISFEGRLFPNYLELEKALQKKQVHLAWLNPVQYLMASEKELATSLLVANHLGVTAYGIQFFGHKESKFSSYFDVGTNTSTSSPGIALAQFSGLRPCLTDVNSLTGYWIPLSYLKQNNIFIGDPVLTYSYSSSLRALYARGVCDFTATYAISGDPRTASDVINDYLDIMDKLPVIWISPAIIPNLNLSTAVEVPLVYQKEIAAFLLQFSRTDFGKQILSDSNQYEIITLEPLPDDAYTELRNLLLNVDVRLQNLVMPN